MDPSEGENGTCGCFDTPSRQKSGKQPRPEVDAQAGSEKTGAQEIGTPPTVRIRKLHLRRDSPRGRESARPARALAG